jgi:serine/threonine protein kinase
MTECPSKELLNRYIIGDCGINECQLIESHLSKCQACRNKVAINRESSSEQDESVTKTMPGVSDFSPDITKILDKSAKAVFENYKIIGELPRGGQAAVYQAIHIPTKTKVAIKVLLPSLLASARARHYFEREVELIASLDHPNIVKIRDSGIIHGQYFFVMEYIQGQVLKRYITAHNLSFRERVILFNKICTAMIYAHNHGIIHRDLKFGNIIMDEHGEPHILDFGLAKAIGLSEQAEKDSMPTITGQWAGSPSNMSPEQAAGKPDLIDMRTDVYALGIILYYMLTGIYPYDVGGSILEVLQNIQTVEPTRPRQIIRKFDSDVEAILLAALAKDRSQRYQSVAELKKDLENWLQNRPISVKSVSTVYLLRKVISKHRYASTVLGLLLLIIISFSYISFDFYIAAKKSQRQAETISKQWSEQEDKKFSLAQQLTFTRFLEAWQEGRNDDAKRIASFFAKNSKEQKGALFLLNPESLEADFIRKSPKEEWFAYFIIGENHLKNGRQKEALKAYQYSFEASRKLSHENQSDFDKFINNQIKARLYELTAVNSIKEGGIVH